MYVDALIERDSGGQRLYVQQDANWNVTAIVDSTGAPKERYVYDPYGQPSVLAPDWSARASSLFGWIYLHQGGRLDSTSGLYGFRYRDYSPTLGRWLEEDPIQYSGEDSNLYRYVQSQPTGLADPLGLRPWWLIYRDPPQSGAPQPPRRPTGPPRPRDPIDPPYVPGSCWADMRTAYFDPSFNDNWKEGMGQVKVLAEVGSSWDAGAGMWVSSSGATIAGGKITGYTRHGLNQVIGRDGGGVSTKAILDTLRNPTKIIQQSGGKIMYVGQDAVIVTNADGTVITGWATGSQGLRY